MRPLQRKLLRDLWRLRGQAIAIALVVASGVALFVLMQSTYDSLIDTRGAYYERYRFADVFAGLKRAPLSLVERLEEIPGVDEVLPRVVVDVVLDVPDMEEPATGRLVSLPLALRRPLNDLRVLEGRLPRERRDDEVVVHEAFAEAHELAIGDEVVAIINGTRKELVVVGIGLSPEYVYTIRPGDLVPDAKRFGVFWIERRALAAAFDMEGAFNDLSLSLQRGVDPDAVIPRVDALLERYGGLGAIPRQLQLSHFYLDNELEGLRSMSLVVPLIFLGVTAFLLHVVLSRVVEVERGIIATLKALGYRDLELGLHYLGWALGVALCGGALGIGVGAWFGTEMTALYGELFRFPILLYDLPPSIVAGALLLALAAASSGALFAVRRALTRPPAEAMRPEPPTHYRQSLLERAGLKPYLAQPTRIALRSIERRPLRAFLATFGIAMSGALVVVGSFTLDAVDRILAIQFGAAARYDVALSFVEPRPASAIYDLARYPGVLALEPQRSAPVRFVAGPAERTGSITGLPPGTTLRRIVDADFDVLSLPAEGLLLSQALAEILGVEAGDTLRVEVLEGRRPVLELPVAALVEDYMGTSATMDIDRLREALGEGDTVSGAYLLVDTAEQARLWSALKRTPAVAGFSRQEAAVENFMDTFGEMILTTRVVNVLFSIVIAFGVVYNSARIALAERARELATLRVIGFHKTEVARVLLGELGIIVGLALPLGLLLGRELSRAVVVLYSTELLRMPFVVSSSTYGLSALVILAAALISGYAVKRRADRLDLVEVLKTRE